MASRSKLSPTSIGERSQMRQCTALAAHAGLSFSRGVALEAQEDGAANGVAAFHRHLPLAALRGEKVGVLTCLCVRVSGPSLCRLQEFQPHQPHGQAPVKAWHPSEWGGAAALRLPGVRRAARPAQVVWNLADPPQRSATRKALANATNIAIRAPVRAGSRGSRYVTVKGAAHPLGAHFSASAGCSP